MKLINEYILKQELDDDKAEINLAIVPMKYSDYRLDPFSKSIYPTSITSTPDCSCASRIRCIYSVPKLKLLTHPPSRNVTSNTLMLFIFTSLFLAMLLLTENLQDY